MQAFEEHRRFREGRESVKDDKRPGRPQTFHIAENIKKFLRRYELNMHRVRQHIVPRMLNEDKSADEVKSASQAE
ncbi:hypothetical protein TNCV_1522651 [Trichonephila clavipes]|nr:hypothetical protein TNCV_1522651 [Trichonephila clavipes]